MYNQHRAPTGTHSFTAKLDGRYNYCFSNEMSTVSPKTVSCVPLPARLCDSTRATLALTRLHLIPSSPR